ncbi:mannose-6-phosphate isomerase, class I [Okibacterium endophyticum]
MHRLTGIERGYSWGSTSAIQNLLGRPADGQPLAEVWFGAHPTGPSLVDDPRADTLDELIASEPKAVLGDAVSSRHGGRLPFLLKFLAPGQPVSLQVHPSPERAAVGFERENAAGVAVDAFDRTFKDTSHKPEMVFALTDFDGLVGLRPLDQVTRLLGEYRHPAMRAAHDAIAAAPDVDGARRVLGQLVQLAAGDVDEIVAESDALAAAADEADADAFRTVVELAEYYPGDAGTVASLLLNRIRFSPGQGVFVASGMPHAYISGLAVEVMANSDNVIRAGLTGKHVDVEGLLENTIFEFGPPALLPADEVQPGVRALRPDAREFEVYALTPRPGVDVHLEGRGPRIVVCTHGSVTLSVEGAPGRDLTLATGDAAFLSDADAALTANGDGSLVLAGVPAA